MLLSFKRSAISRSRIGCAKEYNIDAQSFSQTLVSFCNQGVANIYHSLKDFEDNFAHKAFRKNQTWVYLLRPEE